MRPLLAPFAGLFGTAHAEAGVVEMNQLLVIVIYALSAWVLLKAVRLVMSEYGYVRIPASQIDTRVR